MHGLKKQLPTYLKANKSKHGGFLVMWFKDEQTRQLDCVIDGARVAVANSFFPNILKAKDTVGEDKAISVYDLFAKKSHSHSKQFVE